MFHALTKDSKTPNMMDRVLFTEFFRVLFGITDSLMLDQIFYYFDADREGSVRLLHCYLPLVMKEMNPPKCAYLFAFPFRLVRRNG